jgi:hypothetical protein
LACRSTHARSSSMESGRSAGVTMSRKLTLAY